MLFRIWISKKYKRKFGNKTAIRSHQPFLFEIYAKIRRKKQICELFVLNLTFLRRFSTKSPHVITTGIHNAILNGNEGIMYDMSGRQIKHAKGLVIIGKKKYMVK